MHSTFIKFIYSDIYREKILHGGAKKWIFQNCSHINKLGVLNNNQLNNLLKEYIERILHGGAKISILFSSGKTIFYEQAQRVSKILFLPRENKIHIFKPPCNIMFFLLSRQKDIDKILEGKYWNYVIDKLWKINHSGPGCSFYEFYEWYIFQ